MSMFGSIMNDFDDDPYFGAHFRQMRQMNSMMSSINSMFSDPFGAMGGPLAIMGQHHHPRNPMMPFMPAMNMNRLLTGMVGSGVQPPVWAFPQLPGAAAPPYSGGLDDSMLNGRCNSFSSSTVVMSNGPDGRPQVYSATSSTNVGPGGVKETRQTVQDSRTGTKKMSIGHHINDRAHVIEREQNVRSGDLEEHEEFINIEEEEAEEFNREFGQRLRGNASSASDYRRPRQLALAAPPTSRRELISSRRPLRHISSSSALTTPYSPSSSAVRQTYSSLHPQRTKQRNPKHHHNHPDY